MNKNSEELLLKPRGVRQYPRIELHTIKNKLVLQVQEDNYYFFNEKKKILLEYPYWSIILNLCGNGRQSSRKMARARSILS